MNMKNVSKVRKNAVDKYYEAEIDGTIWFIPIEPNNRHYAELKKLEREGKIVINDRVVD